MVQKQHLSPTGSCSRLYDRDPAHKKDGSQSAISDFEEYTMIKPRQFAEFAGFTEEEVQRLCREKDISFSTMKYWYDGYAFEGIGSIYNPNSVMKAIRNRDFDSYWTESSAAEGLLEYISKDYNGLAKTIAELIGGVDVKVNTVGFANDLTSFRGKDDVLTLMIHLGYLAYDSKTKTVRIPNEEIRREFGQSVREVKHTATLRRLAESEQLFLDTVQLHEEKVAAQIEKIHAEETAPLHYNREESLRSVIKLAFYTYRDHYLQFEELPAGEGYADIIYIPRPDTDWPALANIGRQINTVRESWIDFFRECRLQVQLERAHKYFSASDRKAAQRLLDHLDEYLIEPDHPSLLHGDL